jgi:hypothetical protein
VGHRLFYCTCLVCLLVACTVVEPVPLTPTVTEVSAVADATRSLTPSPVASTTPFRTFTPTATQTTTHTPRPTTTRRPTLTPPPTSNFNCPELGAAIPLDQPENTAELREAIVGYLNSGGQWDSLADLFESWNFGHEITHINMNGDDVLETVVHINVVNNHENDIATWVFHCQSNQYQIIFQIRWGMFRFHRYSIVDDLNSDGNFEIVMVGGFAGSACDLEPTVLGWEGNGVVDYSPDYLELELGCSPEDRVNLEDIDGDGVKELIVSGETVGHLDYAPPRGITQTFAVENQAFRLISTTYSATNVRIHVLDDAQRAFDERDFALAIELYDRAAHDDSLTNVSSYYYPDRFTSDPNFPEDNPNEYQRAFALFRLAAIYRTLLDAQGVTSTLAELAAAYPEGSPGSEFAVLAHLFIDLLDSDELPAQACQAVTEFIEANYPDLSSHFYWGANIAFYHDDDFCPFWRSPN